MTINKDLISRLEKLARLRLEDSERQVFANDLTNILEMVDKLKSLDTDGVEPLVYLSDAQNVFREDEVRNQLTREEALQNAPKQDGTFFRVPKVIE